MRAIVCGGNERGLINGVLLKVVAQKHVPSHVVALYNLALGKFIRLRLSGCSQLRGLF
jgi:hypothetical protein